MVADAEGVHLLDGTSLKAVGSNVIAPIQECQPYTVTDFEGFIPGLHAGAAYYDVALAEQLCTAQCDNEICFSNKGQCHLKPWKSTCAAEGAAVLVRPRAPAPPRPH